MEARVGLQVELADHAAVGVDLFQPAHDLFGVALDLQRGGEQLVPARGGAAELVADHVVHPPQLTVEFLAQFGIAGVAVHARAQHPQRRF